MARHLVVALLFVTTSFSCYDTTAIALRVRTANTEMDCVEVADGVFDREGFAVTPNVSGTRFYSPRASATTALALQWGIAVSIEGGPGKDGRAPCTFELQALSTDESCGIQCPLTPQPGYGDVTRKMAGLLDAAFSVPARRSSAADR
ncbi:MAG TPA: hypothetical protein VIF57_09750 [Polyangia bacterium]|jgi:hypothetical protein